MLTSATATTFVVANLVSILLEAINVPVAQVTLQQKRIKNVRVRSTVQFILTKQFTKVWAASRKALTQAVLRGVLP